MSVAARAVELRGELAGLALGGRGLGGGGIGLRLDLVGAAHGVVVLLLRHEQLVGAALGLGPRGRDVLLELRDEPDDLVDRLRRRGGVGFLGLLHVVPRG